MTRWGARAGPPLLLMLGALPFAFPSGFVLTTATLLLLTAILGQSWNILGGYGGQSSFGHALFYGTGAFTTALLQVRFGWNAWVAAAAAIGAGTLVGAAAGALVFRQGLRGSYFALVTLAFAEIARVLVASFDITGGGFGLLVPLHRGAASFQFSDPRLPYWIAWTVVLAGVLLTIGIERSRFGARLAAVRENEDAARALGIAPVQVKTVCTAISAGLAATAGVLYLQIFLFIDAANGFGVGVSVQALLAPILGGLATPWGALLGALALRLMAEMVHAVAGGLAGIDLALFGVILILILRFAPGGIAGIRLRRDA
ncbi:MAG: branched-chain amino acid ABC transporter permease [Rhodospirillales bacterium]|nr:branched-chain amino acid ABC transporter permease [Rhodospirillales bacterium]